MPELPVSIRLRDARFYERPVTLRMPFRFGALTLTEAPQSFVRVVVETRNGTTCQGWAAELLIPKWFDKSPRWSNDENIAQLRASLLLAARQYQSDSGFHTPFGLHARHYAQHMRECGNAGLEPLVASFGTALIDRAILDALCRHLGLTIFEAVRCNLPAIDLSLTPELKGFDLAAFLRQIDPALTIHARHTVGMLDAITEGDRPRQDSVNDGLPETLEWVVEFYGNRYYKLKVRGDARADVERLEQIASVLDTIPGGYHATLDGNEQYESVDGVIELLSALEARPRLRQLRQSILFLEQPIKRSAAFATPINAVASRMPVEIDESDGDLAAFPAARKLGYRGVSSKSCKGFYRALLNAARCAHWNAEERAAKYFMSAEDLVIQAGVALQQDLALARIVGCTHIERNGHHYVNGMAHAPAAEQERFLSAHGDLYHRQDGVVRLRVDGGVLRFDSIRVPGLGCATEPLWSEMQEHTYAPQWRREQPSGV